MTKVNKVKGKRMTKVERNNRKQVRWRKEAKSMMHFKNVEGRKRRDGKDQISKA